MSKSKQYSVKLTKAHIQVIDKALDIWNKMTLGMVDGALKEMFPRITKKNRDVLVKHFSCLDGPPDRSRYTGITLSDCFSGQWCTCKFTEKELMAITKALEAYERFRMGQVNTALDIYFDYKFLAYNTREDTHRAVRAILFPKLAYTASYGIGNKEVGDGNLAYEIYKVFGQFLAVTRNGGFFDSAFVNFQGPLQVTKEPFPVVLDFKPYKDVPIPKKLHKEIKEFAKKKNWWGMWELIDKNIKKKLYTCEKTEVIIDEMVVRCHKPQRKPEVTDVQK